MKAYKPFTNVKAVASNSSYGRWVVKTDEVTFRFFWKKDQADLFAWDHNNRVGLCGCKMVKGHDGSCIDTGNPY